MSPPDRTAYFRRLHENRPLILPNAWDAASARVMELAGALAIGTTSAGIAWSCGRRDGQKLQRDEMIRRVRPILQAVDVPVTVDIESGYGTGTPPNVAETVHAVTTIGAVGVNLEDSPGRDGTLLLAPEEQAERIRAAREAARATTGDLVINARTDVYLARAGVPKTRFAETVQRANRYHAAGADCLFVPGVTDAETIAALVQEINGPVNIMAVPGAPRISELGRLGVARVSLGPAFAQAMLATTRQATRDLLEHGTYHALEHALPFDEANSMFA